jgi:hypothetical protein
MSPRAARGRRSGSGPARRAAGSGRVPRRAKPARVVPRSRRAGGGGLRSLLDACVRGAMARATVPGVAVGVRVGSTEVMTG